MAASIETRAFGKNDIRGIYGEDITEEDAKNIKNFLFSDYQMIGRKSRTTYNEIRKKEKQKHPKGCGLTREGCI